MPRNAPTSRQLTGSEYSGVERTAATIQPKPADTLTNGEILRLGYLTGREDQPESLEDRRQMVGLLPSTDTRPNWLANTGRQSYANEQHLGEDPLEVEP
jgi:hypothetical protein